MASSYDRTFGPEEFLRERERRPSRSGQRLAEACAPLFLFLTTFRRNSRTSDMSPSELRNRLRNLLDATKSACEQSDHLRRLLEDVWYTLVVTADQAVLTSEWSERVTWSMDLLETHFFSTAEGGKRFYDVVEETLSKSGEEAAEVAEVLFTCMALGFQGELLQNRQLFERKRGSLYEKARLPGALGDVLTPESYGENVSRSLTKLPTAGLRRIVVVSLVMFAMLWVMKTTYVNYLTDDVIAQIKELRAELNADRGASQ